MLETIVVHWWKWKEGIRNAEMATHPWQMHKAGWGVVDSFRPATIPGIRQTKQIWEMASNLSSVCGGVGDRESLRSVLIEHHTIYLLFTTQTTFTVLAAPANRFDEIGSFFPVYCDKKKKKSTLGSSSFVNDVTQRSMTHIKTWPGKGKRKGSKISRFYTSSGKWRRRQFTVGQRFRKVDAYLSRWSCVQDQIKKGGRKKKCWIKNDGVAYCFLFLFSVGWFG